MRAEELLERTRGPSLFRIIPGILMIVFSLLVVIIPQLLLILVALYLIGSGASMLFDEISKLKKTRSFSQ